MIKSRKKVLDVFKSSPTQENQSAYLIAIDTNLDFLFRKGILKRVKCTSVKYLQQQTQKKSRTGLEKFKAVILKIVFLVYELSMVLSLILKR